MTDVLFGETNPSAKLPITFPSAENDINMTQSQWPGVNGESRYSEGLLVGYRYYDAHNIRPKFAFGTGLSYTTFEYSALHVTRDSVTCVVTNVGDRDGGDVPQLYLGFPASAGEPPMQLKGFSKIALKKGEHTTVTFSLDNRSFSVWDVAAHDWSVVSGTFDVFVGSSSADIRLKDTLEI